MTRTRIHNLSISLDGFATGEGQRADAPMGHAGRRLHEWMFATGFGAPIVGAAAGSEGTDDAIARQHEPGIGAEIMGAGKFGPPGWQDDADWKGWWGPNPPFHTPTFVLTHRPRPPIEMEGAPPSIPSTPRRPRPSTSRARQRATRTCASVAA